MQVHSAAVLACEGESGEGGDLGHPHRHIHQNRIGGEIKLEDLTQGASEHERTAGGAQKEFHALIGVEHRNH